MPRDARVTQNGPQGWTNLHQNVVQQIDCSYDVWNPEGPVTDGWSDMRLTVAKLQSLIADAARDHTRLRAYGGTWALSPVAVTNGRLINTKALNWWFPLQASLVSPRYTGIPGNLVFAQCGVSVDELNVHLAARGSALRTSGASNGQTIVGAISTGTHGAALDVGSMQDFIVGMHIIVSPTRSVWIERQSSPVASDAFASLLGADMVKDDHLFEAALVSFGSFGIVHGVVLEAEPVYLLEASRVRIPVDGKLKDAMVTADLSQLPLPSAGERPFHFEVVLNPHDAANGAFVTTMFKRPYRPDYVAPPQPGSGPGPGDDLLAVIGLVGDVLPALVPAAVNAFVAQTYLTFASRVGTPGEMFPALTVHGKGMGMEMGVAREGAPRVLDCLLGLHKEFGPFAGMFAFRFVKGSAATLAFTRFPVTCAVELPGVFSSATAQFFDRVWGEFEHQGIRYTMHWGQVNSYTPERVRAMYGAAAVESWMQCRRGILPADMLDVFSNPFLESCGLADSSTH